MYFPIKYCLLNDRQLPGVIIGNNRSALSVSNIIDDEITSANTTRVSSVVEASVSSANTSSRITRSQLRGLPQPDLNADLSVVDETHVVQPAVDDPVEQIDMATEVGDQDVVPNSTSVDTSSTQLMVSTVH